MKSEIFKKKLALNKTTIANLNNHQMNGVHGGIVAVGGEPVAANPHPTSTFDRIKCPCDNNAVAPADPVQPAGGIL